MISYDKQIRDGKILVQKIKANVFCYRAKTYGEMFRMIDNYLCDIDDVNKCEKYEDPTK